MGWRQTFPDYDVPAWVERDRALEDWSGPGGEIPWFVESLFGEDPDDLVLSIWVDRPGRSPRYAVLVESQATDTIWIVTETDDEVIAKNALRWVRDTAARHGPAAFWQLYADAEGERLFDEGGRPVHGDVASFDLGTYMGAPRSVWGIPARNPAVQDLVDRLLEY